MFISNKNFSSSGDKIGFTQEEENKLIVAKGLQLSSALGLGVERAFRTIANDATKLIKENATMRYKMRKAEKERMRSMNN